MADNKLQELIETLRKQAVESGEASSRQIIEKAEKEAEEIRKRAEAEAETIVRQAREEAENQMRQLASSLEIAGSQFVTNLKRVIEENLLTLPLKEKLREALGDVSFLKELLATVVEAFAKHPEKADLDLLVPKEQQEALLDFVMELARKQAAEGEKPGLTLKAGDVEFGFMIDKADGNVRLDFTDEAFLSLFLKYLTPRFRELFHDIKLEKAAGK